MENTSGLICGQSGVAVRSISVPDVGAYVTIHTYSTSNAMPTFKYMSYKCVVVYEMYSLTSDRIGCNNIINEFKGLFHFSDLNI